MWRAIVLGIFVPIFLALMLNPESVSAVDSYGKWWEWVRGHGWADFNRDCIIDVLDEQASAFRYGASWPMLLYDPYYDLEPEHFCSTCRDDWDIDIKDLQFVFGRDGLSCTMFWDPNLSMGEYSYRLNIPTGPGTVCYPPISNPPGSAYYIDSIGVVFYDNATIPRLEQEALVHGFPILEYNPEQRFWEVGRCTFEDIDASYRIPGTGGPDPYEQWHFRAEVGDEEISTQWGPFGGHVNWGTFAAATPHFDDDDNFCGHFVPEVFPYPDWLYPGFYGSGFEAGTYWVYEQFVLYGGHGFAGREYWGNVTAIPQSCGNNQWPASDGYVYYIEIL